MVTKRRPPKQNSEQGASAKPARPSVKGKPVARSTQRPGASSQATAPEAGSSTAGEGRKLDVSAGQTGGSKRRIAMPQSSSRLKRNQAANKAAASAADPAAAAQAGGSASGKQATRAGKPTKARKPLSTPSADAGAQEREAGAAQQPQGSASPKKPRRLKRFSVAKADKTASDQAKELEGTVGADDASQAESQARSAIAADAAKRRLERRQRMMRRAEGGEAAAQAPDEAASGADRAAQAEGQAAGGAAARARKKPAVHLTWPVVIALIVVALIAATVAVFSWGRWLRYDDAADFQGMWYADGTTSVVTVDGEKIHLTDDVAYGYTLDTGAKTITFTFGNLQGQGRYRFSVDRSELVITDGDGFTFWGTLFDDIGWQLDQAIRSLQGQEIPREAAVDGTTVLDRTPTQGAVSADSSASGASASASGDAQQPDSSAEGAVEDGESADGSAALDGEASAEGEGSADSSFTGAVAEGGIDSAGSNAVTLEQLKNGSLQ